jgi:hypothetical protein
MDLLSLVSKSDQRLDQNVLKNRSSQYEMMVCGIPKCNQTHSKKILVVASYMMLFLKVTIITILEKLSTNPKHSHFLAWWTGSLTSSSWRLIPMACQE